MKVRAFTTAAASFFIACLQAEPAIAAAVIDTTGWGPTSGIGTPITLAGAASPQYYYHAALISPLSNSYGIAGQGGATIAYPGSTTFQTSLVTAATTGIGFTVFAGDYSLLFSANGNNYAGTATVNSTGFITQIVYDLAPVPEPGTWAMMLLGFGLLGVAMRHSQKSSGQSLESATVTAPGSVS